MSGWGNQKSPAMGELGEHEEVIELHYGMVSSNEYSGRDGPWLFHPDNPDREGCLGANTLEGLEVITDDTMALLDPRAPLPEGATDVVPVVLIYCRKREDSAGSRRFKCRAVVLGNLQKGSPLPNFAPVISIPGVRMLLTQAVADAVGGGSGISLFDLSNAFLNAELTPEDGKIVIKLPESWAREKDAKYATLKRALYGPKIPPRRWYDTIDAFLKTRGWSAVANCLYKKILGDGTGLWVGLYVGGCIMGGGTVAQRDAEISDIFKRFPGKMIEPVEISPLGAFTTISTVLNWRWIGRTIRT